ncbi:MAG: DUF2130 domain-containing protein [Hyphomicrobiaceae bacterium]|nr:DUF2130 domain-containing protein [Hyphomicrobiaceae bacterium]
MAGLNSAAAHVHDTEGEFCPWCEQPISHDKFEEIRRRMTEEQEQRMAALVAEHERKAVEIKARAKAALEAGVEAARRQAAADAAARLAEERARILAATQASEAAKAAEFQRKLEEAEAARAAVQAQMAALKAEQERSVAERVALARETLQQERDAAVLAEKSKAFEETQRLQQKLQDLQRQLEAKTSNELGEASEIDLFEALKEAFPEDRIWRVGKGVNGADVIHIVLNNGQECGKIIYDAKNRNAWQNEFVNKLRADKIAEGADHAILSSNKFPKDKQQIHPQDGVIVAAPSRVVALAQILRGQVLRMHALRASSEERGQKSEDLYRFITSEHFKQLVDQVETQVKRMLELDQKEQEAHRRLWDQRNKLIRSVEKARGDLSFEVDRIIGTAGNGPEADAAGEAA